MAKKRNAEIGDVLDAVERASAAELRELRAINKKLGSVSSQNISVKRQNGAKDSPKSDEIDIVLREIRKKPKQSQNEESLEQKGVQMRAFSRNKEKLSSNDTKIAQKAAETIAKHAANKISLERDARGRFVSPKRLGGDSVTKKMSVPRQVEKKSLWAEEPAKPTQAKATSKSVQAQANAKADANREAVEEQTKATIARQDKTNSLLEDLLKESKNKNKDAKKSKNGGDGDGGDSGGGLFDWWRNRRNKKRKPRRGSGGKKRPRGRPRKNPDEPDRDGKPRKKQDGKTESRTGNRPGTGGKSEGQPDSKTGGKSGSQPDERTGGKPGSQADGKSGGKPGAKPKGKPGVKRGRKGGILGKVLGIFGGGLAAKSAYDLATGDGDIVDVADTAMAATDVAEAAANTKTGKAVTSGVGAVAEKTGIAKLAEKSGIKAVTKLGVKAIPIVGTAIGAGIDAVQGWNDTEGQARAFNLAEGQEATTRQQAEYSLANIADMGGLVSGASNLIGMGAGALGFDKVAEKLSFSTDDIARGIDDVGNGLADGWKSITDVFSTDSEEKDKKDDERNDKLITAVSALGLDHGDAHNTTLNPAAQSVVNSKVDTFAGDITQVTGTRADGYRLGGKGAKLRNKRNNNFGNLSYEGWVKSFEGAQMEARPGDGSKSRFASFATPDQGIRANATQLHRYGTGEFQGGAKGKLNTISKVINTWAPPGENNTAAYIQNVSKQLGVGPNDQLNMDDPKVIEALMRAIAKVEGGDISMSSEAFQASLGELKNGRWVAQETPEEIRKKIETSGAINIGKVEPIQRAEATTPEGASITAPAAAGLNIPLDGIGGMGAEYAEKFLSLVKMGDKGVGEKLASMGVGHLRQQKSPGLTLPKGAKAMPWLEGGKPHKLPPLQDVGSLSEEAPKGTAPAPAAAGTSPTTPPVNAATQKGEATTPAKQSATQAAQAGEVVTVPANMLNKAMTPEEYKAATAKTSATDSQKTPGILDIVRSSAAETFNWATQGLSGSTMIDGLLGDMNPLIADAIKPLTNAAGTQLDKWIGSGRDTVTEFLNGRPTQMPSVTDLSASGAAETVKRDGDASKSDLDMLDQLKLIATHLEDLMGITRDGQKDTTNPNDTQHTAQPAPNPDIPTEGFGSALLEMLRGVL